MGDPRDYWKRDPADYGFPEDAKAGDVINRAGDLLGFPCDRIVKAGMVFVTADQADRAASYGWRVHPTSAPDRNEGLVTISR
ncbi:hypothetical protein [Methylobacterium fujisawaense]|uniref:hypothetical protein n=1 Tax=Methylobacterium fujisawaense TaxID=107400 RepID=UPI00313D0499